LTAPRTFCVTRACRCTGYVYRFRGWTTGYFTTTPCHVRFWFTRCTVGYHRFTQFTFGWFAYHYGLRQFTHVLHHRLPFVLRFTPRSLPHLPPPFGCCAWFYTVTPLPPLPVLFYARRLHAFGYACRIRYHVHGLHVRWFACHYRSHWLRARFTAPRFCRVLLPRFWFAVGLRLGYALRSRLHARVHVLRGCPRTVTHRTSPLRFTTAPFAVYAAGLPGLRLVLY